MIWPLPLQQSTGVSLECLEVGPLSVNSQMKGFFLVEKGSTATRAFHRRAAHPVFSWERVLANQKKINHLGIVSEITLKHIQIK